MPRLPRTRRARCRAPRGEVRTYSWVAQQAGRPDAIRAVGNICARNVVPFVVPCHRVLAKSGGLCGYHWGLTRKQAILGWEAGLLTRAS